MEAALSDEWVAAEALAGLFRPRGEEPNVDAMAGAFLLAVTLGEVRALVEGIAKAGK